MDICKSNGETTILDSLSVKDGKNVGNRLKAFSERSNASLHFL